MKKWIIIIASVATVLIVSMVVLLGILNREPQVEVTTGEYFEGITWDTSISDAKSKLTSERYEVLRKTFYTKSYFNGMEDATAVLAMTPIDGETPETFILMFSCESESTYTSETALKQLKKAYEKAFNKLTDKKITKKELAEFTDEDAILGDENITWITENSCINLMYTKNKKLTISYEKKGTEYSDFIETCIKLK